MMGTEHRQEQSASLDPENLGLELRLHMAGKMIGLFHFYGRFLEPFPATCGAFPEPLCSRIVFEFYELLLIVQNCLFFPFFLLIYYVYVYVKLSQRWYLVLKHRGAWNTLKRKLHRKCNDLNLSKINAIPLKHSNLIDILKRISRRKF